MSDQKTESRPDPRYRPNPARAVYLQSQINQEFGERLTPQIIRLQAADRSPLTVYVACLGDSTFYAELLLKLLVPLQMGNLFMIL